MNLLEPEELRQLLPAETHSYPSPIPTQHVVRGLGADHVVWGTDAIWTGSPRWQIEALRRLEIPGDMQEKYGFKPLGPADGPVKTAIFGETNARLYKYEQRAALATDRIAIAKATYEESGPARSNLRYGYVLETPGRPGKEA